MVDGLVYALVLNIVTPERCERKHDRDIAHVARVFRGVLLVLLLVTILQKLKKLDLISMNIFIDNNQAN